eukprot:493754-Pleurochrysis_carterae.AAC.1
MRRQNDPQYFYVGILSSTKPGPAEILYAGIINAPIKCMRRYGYMPAHPVNWLIGQKACGCATETLCVLWPVEPKPGGCK